MDNVVFTVNGETHTVSGTSVSPWTSLVQYVRESCGLSGTKAMCHEGGCGACVVSVELSDPRGQKKTVAVNSCLVHVLSCHGWAVRTVEGVGGRGGRHALQTRLAAFHGTQCGYCSPGWITSMYSLLQSKKKLTMEEIERSFGGNMCRCTGYRPILDAFKTFATDLDLDPALQHKLKDVEDLDQLRCLSRSSSSESWCMLEAPPPCQELRRLDFPPVRGRPSARWYKAFRVQDVFRILKTEGSNDYRLVNGNTGKGVYPISSEPRIQIDISSISSLRQTSSDVNLVLGAGLTLSELLDLCRLCQEKENFKYLKHFWDHLDLVAHVPVRNIGTIGGNLALKNQHNEFQSDIFVLFETVRATVTIMDKTLNKTEMNLPDFLKQDLTEKLIIEVKIPPLSKSYHMRTYKIMPRAQNAHAIVNAGFLFKLDPNNKVETCNIVYGSISPDFIHATETEKALKGLELFKNETLQLALKKLDKEIVPEDYPPETSSFSKKMIALGLFYKAIISLSPAGVVSPRYESGGAALPGGVSRGTQTFDTDDKIWPLNEPVQKLEALAQCSGEVKYSDDAPGTVRDVHLAFVLASVGKGTIDHIDSTDALNMPGVVSVLTAADIPGKNSFTPLDVIWQETDEEVLASTQIHYDGQPIGLVAATDRETALRAAALVRVSYRDVQPPLITIQQVLDAPDAKDRMREEIVINATDRGTNTTQVLKGSFTVPSQYHYTMETQTCRAEMSEHGIDVRSATQWMELVQVAVARLLHMPENQVNVSVGAVGGAYGGKASRSALSACACALAAWHTQRPARLVMSLSDNMRAIGKRQECLANYEVGIDDEGEIQYLDVKYYSACGWCYNDAAGGVPARVLCSLYRPPRCAARAFSLRADLPGNTWCRAPGTTEGTAIIDHIMERIAFAVKKDSCDIKLLNLSPEHTALRDMILSLKSDSKYEERKAEIEKYNSENVWTKRAIKMSAMVFPVEYTGNFAASLAVFQADGSVALTHAGVEMGQGINTKAAQVCAYTLKIPLEKVSVKPCSTMITPNAMVSNGSITSECVAYAVTQACAELERRLRPVREKLHQPSWEQLVKQAYKDDVDLSVSYMWSTRDGVRGYSAAGAAVAEALVDALTGRHVFTRFDLLEDAGRSLSPEIDVGQMEGALVMGLGLWTCEEVRTASAGRLLTDNTWRYRVPGARDIPRDLRLAFRRNVLNPAGVLSSKATGEPALLLAVSAAHALRQAALAARPEAARPGSAAQWIHVDTPYTVDNLVKAISADIEQFKLN